ncbi:cellulase Cel9A precursor [Piromyces finnis]|uniref:Endoglucanase n=1 Tax=Piromyces finnis TaxID=1754191 RepID=A0A1Y1VJ66_9FUNG|nr:cellulase Cel9A precursor [Piromyces finnis]|eukprot:ORX57760.1 cellulase Cel9A precursor [Piromyces finnis]
MKFQKIVSAIAALVAPMAVVAKSQDYARHIELSLLFYEAQRSGKLPENNRVYWRHDSLLDAGADNGVDLTGGYYDAGDNVKFNFPGAAALTLLAWSGIDYADGYKEAGQWDYILDAVRWGADYFVKCHTGKNELYVQVGKGATDHGFWYPPEYVQYDHPSYKITAAAPGSEVAGDTASFLAAASILFKDIDSSYSSNLLKHAIEIYDFADSYRGEYIKAVPDAQGFYSNWSGYNDELAFGALWLYRATGESKYMDKFSKIADASYGEQDTKAYGTCTGPISWDDKRPGAYILAAIITGDEKRMKQASWYCDNVLTQPKTPGGLWYDANLSKWASNRYASNAAAMVAMYANYLPSSDSKRSKYVDFVKKQTDYILGDNPAKINYVVGAEANSPKAVHHRGASGTYDSQDTNAKPTDYNIFTLWGALAGGPGPDDEYTDSRKNYEMNEVALDYNAAFQMNLAFLVKEGFNKPDPDSVKIHDRSFPKKADTPDVKVEVTEKTIEISTGSNMMCSSWCIEFTTDYKIEAVHDCIMHQSGPDYIICNRRESNFLDGKGTPQIIKYQGSNGQDPLTINESVVMCDGWHAPQSSHKPVYRPENGRRYKVTGSGGVGNTTPLFEQSECWPAFLCGGSNTTPKTTIKKTTTTTKKSEPTSSSSCFAKSMGYACCSVGTEVVYTDNDGQWGIENGQWCGIGGGQQQQQQEEKCGDYACCSGCESVYVDNDGKWGVENGNWCLIKESKCGGSSAVTCTGMNSGYQCCDTCNVVYTDNDGKWGIMNGEWCGIKSSC